MIVYKITHKERDHSKTWRTVYSIVPALTREDAIKKLDRHKSLIKKIEFLGVQKKDTYAQYWNCWNDKKKAEKAEIRHAIYEIKPPSHKKKK